MSKYIIIKILGPIIIGVLFKLILFIVLPSINSLNQKSDILKHILLIFNLFKDNKIFEGFKFL